MCYQEMMEKRSDAEQKRVDTTLTTKDMAAPVLTPAAVRSEAKDKAYTSFMARLQRWIAKATKAETTP